MKRVMYLAMGLCLAVSLAFAAPVVAAPGDDEGMAPRKERLHRAGSPKSGDIDKSDMKRHERRKGDRAQRDDMGKGEPKDKKARKSKKDKKDMGDKPGKGKKHPKDKKQLKDKKGKHGKGIRDAKPANPNDEAANDRDVWLKRAQNSDMLSGKASWYGRDFHGGQTASGVNYDMYTFTAAHRTLPIGTIVKVTDEYNGKNVLVCVTDRGPFVHGRVIDLSMAAAKQLDMSTRGVAKVNLEVVSDERGVPLKSGQAWFIQYKAASGQEKVGPYSTFADAAAMHEALRQAHPEAEVIVE